MVWLLQVAGWRMWCVGVPFSLWSSPVMDVPVIMQLKFLHYFENVEVPQFPFLDRALQIPVVLQRRVRAVQTVQNPEIPPCSSSTLFTCPLLCVDRCRMSRQCRKLESPQLVLLLDKVVDVPVLATSWVVEVRSCSSLTGVSAHHGYDELTRRLFRAVCTGTRPGLTPAIRAGKGWRERRELAPRRSATQIRCISCVAWTDTPPPSPGSDRFARDHFL